MESPGTCLEAVKVVLAKFEPAANSGERIYFYKQRGESITAHNLCSMNIDMRNMLFCRSGTLAMLGPIDIQHGCSHPVLEMNKQKKPPDDPLMQASGEFKGLSLPTLQRNALRKLFNRPDFTPQEVLALGYRNLQRAEGIGSKGLLSIIEWLAGHGLELKSPEVPADPPTDIPESVQRNINVAVRLLRTHGYRVQRTKDKTPVA